MTPSHAVKRAKRYRYYITRTVEAGGPAAWRVPAQDLEKLERGYVEGCAAQLINAPDLELAKRIEAMVDRIDVHRDRLELRLHADDNCAPVLLTASAALIKSGRTARSPVERRRAAGRRPRSIGCQCARRSKSGSALNRSRDRAIADVASEHGFTVHYFSQLARFGSLAPNIVSAVRDCRFGDRRNGGGQHGFQNDRGRCDGAAPKPVVGGRAGREPRWRPWAGAG